MIALGITHDKNWETYLGVTGFSIAGALSLLMVAIGFKDKKSWSFAPAILSNMIALGVVKYQLEAKVYILGFPLGITAIVIIIGTFSVIRDSARA